MTSFANLAAALAASRQSMAPSNSASGQALIAHKFGGSSLADADCFRRVADILLARDDAVQITVV
ncbi:MAG: hypothetical protein E6Q43_07005, partial [Dokdonella sp.]